MTITFFKKILQERLKKNFIKLRYAYKRFYFQKEIKKVLINQNKATEKLKRKEKIKIAFYLINVDTWKLDSVYWAFKKHQRFDPIVIICPFITRGQNFLNIEMRKGIEYCKLKNYEYFTAYNETELKVIDVKNIIKPDIVFFTNPNSLTYGKLLIDNYLDTLTCYVPYSFRIDTLYEYEYNNRLVNLVWLNFYETYIHKNLANKFALNKGRNVIVTGFPFLDDYKSTKLGSNVWKNSGKQRKRIIWAPHWTISGFNTGLDWACFLDYYEFILNIAKKFEKDIQFAMKPHPFLKTTLSQESLWGVEKTDQYFNKWDELENCQVVNGDYKQLFLESDALIHDSGSFMVEYLALNKPIAYTISNKSIENRFNEFGQIVLSGHYQIYSENDLLSFIQNLINGIDPLIKQREKLIFKQNLNKDMLISEEIVKQINLKLT